MPQKGTCPFHELFSFYLASVLFSAHFILLLSAFLSAAGVLHITTLILPGPHSVWFSASGEEVY